MMEEISQKMGLDSFDDDYRIYIMGILKRGRYTSRLEDATDTEDVNDPDYTIVLEHLSEHGDSYILQMETNGGMPIVVKYESEDDLPDQMEEKRNLSTKGVKRAYTNTQKCNFPTSNQTIGKNGSKRQNDCKTDWPVHGCKHENEPRVMDDNYMTFINNVRVQGDTMVLELGDITIEYDKIDESPQAPEGSSARSIETCEDLPLVSFSSIPPPLDANIGEHSTGSLSDNDSSSFKENLMAYLSKPYNRKEHKELLREVSICKCVQQERRLRKRSVAYSSEKQGKSYLDYFPDLARELKIADPCRALILLRGFFFWLQHLTQDGAFKPWLTPQDQFAIVQAVDYEAPIQIALPDTYT
ncbi:uncharacterized protein [Aristolochia californica]|uniref:uncharacterized protein n=1 Tax=Aristolochia californica TaxID=171875 RepID=UPI0035E2D40D